MLIATNKYDYLFKLTPECKAAMGGFTMFDDGDHCELWCLHIKESYRSMGYGQQMVKEAIELANGKKLTLYVQKNNPVAIHVYEKCGFKISGVYPRGDDAWEMTYVGNSDGSVSFNECAVA